MEKTCTTCGTVKPAGDFYPTGTRPGATEARCKACACAYQTQRRRTNPAVRAYDRARAKTPDRRARARAITIRFRAEKPDAYRAQTAVGNALRDGRIAREPCAQCGTTENIHAHHHDYSRPLDVIWLCATCHHRGHAQERQAA